jgi:recombination protein RecA
MYDEGIAKMGDILDLGVQFEEIEKRGSYYSYGETRLGQGRENAKDFLRANQEIAEAIEASIRKQVGFTANSVEDNEELSE